MKADGRNHSGGRRRWWVVGGLLGAIAVSGALLAVVGSGDGDAVERDEQVGNPSDGARRMWRHEFSESYAGPVWITVESADGAARTITVTWGEWERRIAHSGSAARTYHFTKGPGPTVETTVRVEPAAVVTFGSGDPPAGAEDVNPGWSRVT